MRNNTHEQLPAIAKQLIKDFKTWVQCRSLNFLNGEEELNISIHSQDDYYYARFECGGDTWEGMQIKKPIDVPPKDALVWIEWDTGEKEIMFSDGVVNSRGYIHAKRNLETKHEIFFSQKWRRVTEEDL